MLGSIYRILELYPSAIISLAFLIVPATLTTLRQIKLSSSFLIEEIDRIALDVEL
jgi:hypothetical protein